MRTIVLILLVGLLTLSGCVFLQDSKGLANEMAELRKSSVPAGLLVPSTPAGQESYRGALIQFRKRVNEGGGAQGNVLDAYVDGSLILLDMQAHTNEAIALLQHVNLELAECGPQAPMTKAIGLYETAHRESQSANKAFTLVRDTPEIANILGADYVLNALQTTKIVEQAHAQRISDLKSACGQTV